MNANQPAFPQHGWAKDPEILARMELQKGLTKREYFSAMAMQGLLANPNFCTLTTEWVCEAAAQHATKWVCEAAAQHADALLAELEKEPKQ
ncbi:MAG: hypothetical protein WCG75_00300 [Armatimonadota bacterium]